MIPFTQYKMPDGHTVEVVIDRPREVEARAHRLIDMGYKFEIEVLMTGQISMEITLKGEPFMGDICDNGPEVPRCIDNMINESHRALIGS
jgi:hypothetical protein